MFIFIINVFYFLLIIILLTFFGNFILRFLKLNFESYLENFLFSLTFSLVLLSLLSYAALIFRLQFLVVPLFWLFIILGFLNTFYLIRKKNKLPRAKSPRYSRPSGSTSLFSLPRFIRGIKAHGFREVENKLRKFKFDWGLVTLVLVLAVLMSSVTVRSGWMTKDGLEFFGANTHDGLWHLSLIGELKNHFPPQHPNFSGIELRSYHYLLDLLLAEFSLVFGFAEADLYSRLFPLSTAFLWCLTTFILAKQYFQDKGASYLTMFFSVLGGSVAYLLLPFHPSGINLDSDFGASSPISSLINLPFAFSIPILALTFYAFIKFLEKNHFGWGLTAALFTGTLFGIKIYAGIIALLAISLSSSFYLIKLKEIKIYWVAIASGFLGAFIYWPTSTKEAGLVFAPGEMVQNIIRGPLSWTLWELRRQIYAEHYNFLGLARMKILSFLVFIFGNLGTKALGTLEILRWQKSKILTQNFGLFFWALFFSFLAPLLFIQSITPFNIIQFWWYFLYLMSFLTAVVIWDFLKNRTKIAQMVSLIIIFIFTAPAAIFVMSGYLLSKTSYEIPNQRLTALQFLKKESSPNDVVLEIPVNIQNGYFNFALPTIPALAQRRVFLGQEINEFPYLDKIRREEELRKMILPFNCRLMEKLAKDFCQKEIAISYETLKRNNINYIFSPQPLFWLDENSKISPLIYSQNEIFIYAVR